MGAAEMHTNVFPRRLRRYRSISEYHEFYKVLQYGYETIITTIHIMESPQLNKDEHSNKMEFHVLKWPYLYSTITCSITLNLTCSIFSIYSALQKASLDSRLLVVKWKTCSEWTKM